MAELNKLATAKQEFEARMSLLPEEIQTALKGQNLKLVDTVFYSAKLIDTTTKDLMESKDSREVGVTNINKAQLDANNYTCITGVQLLVSEESAAVTDEKASAKAANFVAIDEITAAAHKAFVNGEIEIKNGDKILVPRMSLHAFTGAASFANNGKKGFYRLENPKMIVPLTNITPTIYLPAGFTIDNKIIAKIVFYGEKVNA